MKKTKILIATGIFPPQIGGPATYSQLLLEKLPEKGFKVRVQSFGWVLKYPKVIRHLIYFFRVIFSGINADIIYAQDPVSVGLPSLVAARILGKKFYLKIVGDYAWEQGSQRSGVTDLLDQFSTETEKYPFLVRMLKRVQYFVASHADKILVPSKYLKHIITNWGIKPDKITVIYNAFHAPEVHESRDELREKFNWEGTAIISAGRLVPWKGFDTLISLMPEISQETPGVHLYIMGDGPDKSYLSSKIKEFHAGKLVTLLGMIEQSELFKYIKAADLFVLNTSYEGLSHQLLEVMALHTPIVTTSAGGNVEVIDHDQNGIMVNYNDKPALKESIIKVLKNQSIKERFIKESDKKLEMFGEKRLLEETASFLRS